MKRNTNPLSLIPILLLLALGASAPGQEAAAPRTFCNPLNLEYRFQLDTPSRREAADPLIVLYKNDYYLFASVSGGYWYSSNLRDWTFVAIQAPTLPIEDYAPAAVVIGSTLYLEFGAQVFASATPKTGQWQKIADIPLAGILDPALFLDDDGKLYLTYGGSPTDPLHLVQLNKSSFQPVGAVSDTIKADVPNHGWEIPGTSAWPIPVFPDYHVLSGGGPCYVEGSWLNKHNGIYYLQYAAPGTQWQIYADGYYTSTSLLGPWTYAPNNPFSYKPAGFIGGTGHSATFQDAQNHTWHVTTMVVADKHWFERRLGLFPAAYDKDGLLTANTYLGDYPQMNPGINDDPASDNLAGWWLLSYGKPAQASSTLDAAHGPAKAFDENVRSAWSAQTANPGEWLKVDLGKPCQVNAIQVNFAEQDSTALGRPAGLHHQYTIERSDNGLTWTMLVDKSQNLRDVPHDYLELATPARTRWLRLTNVSFPAGAKFSVRDLRVFGNGLGAAPGRVNSFTVTRNAADGRQATIAWQPPAGVEGMIIRYGTAPDKLYMNYLRRGGAGSFTLLSLNTGVQYYFTIDSINDSGLTRGTRIVSSSGKVVASGLNWKFWRNVN